MVTHTCPDCLKTFTHKPHLIRHINKKNKCIKVIIDPLQCIHCEVIFDKHKELISHIKYNCRNKLLLLRKENKKLSRQLNSICAGMLIKQI